jgi:catechol 2,3-dioxygenase-like lactoylglutathione lyase family enzyme
MELPICQIALSVSDLGRSRSWYQGLGLQPLGGLGPIRGEAPAQMLELSSVEVNVAWMAGRDPMSQLELMCFVHPSPRAFPSDWTLRAAGYGITGLVVPDFDRVIARLRTEGTPVAISGPHGRRSAWLCDPDGVPIEIMEADPLGRLPGARGCEGLSSIRTVTFSVADLPRAIKFWTASMGLNACAPNAYPLSEIPELFGGGAGHWQEAVLKGGPFLLRLLAPRAADQALLPNERGLHDIGPINIAVILDDPSAYSALLSRFTSHGYRLACEDPMNVGSAAGTMYARGDQDVSVEMGYVLPGHEESYGWKR